MMKLLVLALSLSLVGALRSSANTMKASDEPANLPHQAADKILDQMQNIGAFDRRASNQFTMNGDRRLVPPPGHTEKEVKEHILSAAGKRTTRAQRMEMEKYTVKGKWGLVWIHSAGVYDWSEQMEDQLWTQASSTAAVNRSAHKASLHISYPKAPEAPLTALGAPLNAKNGMDHISWYDIEKYPLTKSSPPGYGCSQSDAEQNTEIITKAIDDMIFIQGIPAEHIVVAGFGQGGYMTLRAALTYSKTLAGAFVFAGVLPYAGWLHPSFANNKLPVLWLHGTKDDVYPISLQDEGVAALQHMGLPVVKKTCDCHHSADPNMYEALGMFLDELGDPSFQSATWSAAAGSHAWLWVFGIAAWMSM